MLALLLWTALVLLAALAIPLRVTLVADPVARSRYQVHVFWLFGLVRAPLIAGGSTKDARARRSSSRSRKANRSWTFKRTTVFVRASGGTTRALEALRDLISSLRPRVQFLRIELGLDDPADTGRAFAVLAPLSAWLACRYGPIQLTPSFAEPAFRVDGCADFTIVPLQTLGILLGYVLSPSTLRGFYVAQRST